MLGTTLNVDQYVNRLKTELDRLDCTQVIRLADLIYQAWESGNFVFVFGNGGSATTASHLAEDLGKNCIPPEDAHGDNRRRLKVMSLTDNVGWLTALGNDLGYDQIFVGQLMNYGSPGDLAIAISGSGNSPNVLAAVDWANGRGLKTFALTGYNGGRLKAVAQNTFHVELDDMGMAESVHLAILHWIVEDLHARVNQDGRYVRSA